MISIGMAVSRGERIGAWLWDNIIFPKPGSPAERIIGRTKHFLHCLNEPCEGMVT